MHNWDYPKTENLVKNKVWHLERLLIFGLNGEKIDKKLLEQNLDKIKIPENTKAFLELILWNKPF